MLFKVKFVHDNGDISYSEIQADSECKARLKFNQFLLCSEYKSVTLYGQSGLQSITELLKKLNCNLENWL